MQFFIKRVLGLSPDAEERAPKRRRVDDRSPWDDQQRGGVGRNARSGAPYDGNGLPAVGDDVDGYILRRKLRHCAGGAVVYDGVDAHDEKKHYTVKVVPLQDACGSRRDAARMREGMIWSLLRQLQHENIQQLSDCLRYPACMVLVAARHDGRGRGGGAGSVRDLLQRDGVQCERSIRRVAQGVFDALCCLHARGFVHLNVGLDSVELSASGAPRLGDFSRAKLERARARFPEPEGLRRDEPPSRAALRRCEPYAPGLGFCGVQRDLYMLGALLFTMFHGYPATRWAVTRLDNRGRLRRPPERPPHAIASPCRVMSQPFTAFLHKLMCGKPRPHANFIASDPWLSGNT